MENNPISLLGKTYSFILLRLGISLLVIYPGYKAVMLGIDSGRLISGKEFWLLDVLYGYIGLSLFIIYIEFCRKLVIHFVKYAQIACFSQILSGESIKESSLVFGFKAVFRRFGSVSAAYVADVLLHKSLKKTSNWIVNEGNILPDFLKSGRLAGILGTTLKIILSHSVQVVVSYLFVNKDVKVWEGLSKGMLKYAKSWKSVITSALITTIVVKVIGWLFVVSLIVALLWYVPELGVRTMIVILVYYKILTVLLKSAFLEPYLSASMLVAYYKTEDVEGDLTNSLSEISEKFKAVMTRKGSNLEEVSDDFATLLTGNMSGSDEEPIFSKFDEMIKNSKQVKEEQ